MKERNGGALRNSMLTQLVNHLAFVGYLRLCKNLIGNFQNPEKNVSDTEASMEQWEDHCSGKCLRQSLLLYNLSGTVFSSVTMSILFTTLSTDTIHLLFRFS